MVLLICRRRERQVFAFAAPLMGRKIKGQGRARKIVMMSLQSFLRAGRGMFNRSLDMCLKSDKNTFKGHFGISPSLTAKMCGLSQTKCAPSMNSFHLLCALLKLRLWSTEKVYRHCLQQNRSGRCENVPQMGSRCDQKLCIAVTGGYFFSIIDHLFSIVSFSDSSNCSDDVEAKF